MPEVTVFSKPNGEPIASTHSPTRTLEASPSFTVGRSFASIFTTAMSVVWSRPATLPLNSRRSASLTRTSSAPSTTCALVRITPFGSTMKPEPMPSRGTGGWPPSMPKRRRKSLSGLLSSWSSSPWSFPRPPKAGGLGADMVARMFTTAPLFASAMAAKSGSDCTAPAEACAPVGLVEGAAVAPCAAWGLDGVSVAGEHPAARHAVIKENARNAGFMVSLWGTWVDLRCGERPGRSIPSAIRCKSARRRARASRRRPSPLHWPPGDAPSPLPPPAGASPRRRPVPCDRAR